MTKLEIARWLSRKSGVNFAGPSNVASQTGVFLQLIENIDDAYGAIQRVHTTWEFLRKEIPATPLTIGKATYTPAELGITDYGEWAPEDWRVYLEESDESEVFYMPWADFRQAYVFGSHRSTTGRPIAFTHKPDEGIMFYPIPDAAFIPVGEYFRSPHTMTQNDHVPLWEATYHLIVGWKALQYYGGDFSDGDKFNTAEAEYEKMLRQMEKKYLPRIKWGRPLA